MKYALIDGYNLAFRAFYGMPDLSRADGFPTGAIHGWVRSLWWVEDHLSPDCMVVFFDLGGAARQEALSADYKAHRVETPEALRQQLPWIKEWTRAMGYLGIEKHGVEADDLIAAYAQKLGIPGNEVVIVSADKDLGQLVTANVHQLLPPPTANPKLGWRRMDPHAIEERIGLPPAKIPDYLALIGDAVDNIAGLKGVGPKTAVKWLRKYGSVEEIIAHCGELEPKRFQAVVHADQEILRRNLEMTRLDPVHTVDPLDGDSRNPAEVVRILEEMEMASSARQARKRLRIPD